MHLGWGELKFISLYGPVPPHMPMPAVEGETLVTRRATFHPPVQDVCEDHVYSGYVYNLQPLRILVDHPRYTPFLWC